MEGLSLNDETTDREKQISQQDKQKTAMENRKILVDRYDKVLLVKMQELADVRWKMAEDRMKVADDRVKVAEDRVKVAEDRVKVAEDKVEVAEDKVKVTEDRMKVAEDKIKFGGEAANGREAYLNDSVPVRKPDLEKMWTGLDKQDTQSKDLADSAVANAWKQLEDSTAADDREAPSSLYELLRRDPMWLARVVDFPALKEISDILADFTPKQREIVQDKLYYGRDSQRWALETARLGAKMNKANNSAARARRGFWKRLLCGPTP